MTLAGLLGGGTALGQKLTYGPILGRGATPDRMIVRWGTDAPTGTGSLALREKGKGAFAVVAGSETAGPDGAFDHETILDGLALDASYEYQVSVGGTLETHQLTTCPHPGAPMDLVFYGDSRNDPFSSSGQAAHRVVVGRILAAAPDLVIESGDLVYTGVYGDYLTQVFPVLAPLVSSVPFMAVPGNHDNGDPLSLGFGGLPTLTGGFARLFPVPRQDPARFTPYYSFVCGNAQLVGLDSDALVAAGGDDAQLAFLDEQLAAAAGDARIDHVFVFFHHSPYSPASGLLAHGDNAALQASLVPRFADPAHKVTAVFTGHDHIYARLDDGSGVVYVVSGGAGAGLSAVDGSSKAMILARRSAFHFVRVHVAGKLVSATALDDTGATIDTWTAHSKNSAPPPAPPDDAGAAPGSPGADAGLPADQIPPADGAGGGGCAMAGQGSPPLAAFALLALALAGARRRPLRSRRSG